MYHVECDATSVSRGETHTIWALKVSNPLLYTITHKKQRFRATPQGITSIVDKMA